jgi:hypothetical protein
MGKGPSNTSFALVTEGGQAKTREESVSSMSHGTEAMGSSLRGERPFMAWGFQLTVASGSHGGHSALGTHGASLLEGASRTFPSRLPHLGSVMAHGSRRATRKDTPPQRAVGAVELAPRAIQGCIRPMGALIWPGNNWGPSQTCAVGANAPDPMLSTDTTAEEASPSFLF